MSRRTLFGVVGGSFYTNTPGLIHNKVLDVGEVNIGVCVKGERDVEHVMLEITQWDCGDTLQEGVVFTQHVGISIWSKNMHCTHWDKNTDVLFDCHQVSKLRKEFLQEAGSLNQTFDAKGIHGDLGFVMSITDFSLVDFEKGRFASKHIAIVFCFIMMRLE